MANTSAAKKDLRQTEKRTLRNKTIKANIRYLTRQSKKLIEAGDKEKATELISKTIKALDKAKQKNVLKHNTVDRRKSRLMAKFNKASK